MGGGLGAPGEVVEVGEEEEREGQRASLSRASIPVTVPEPLAPRVCMCVCVCRPRPHSCLNRGRGFRRLRTLAPFGNVKRKYCFRLSEVLVFSTVSLFILLSSSRCYSRYYS